MAKVVEMRKIGDGIFDFFLRWSKCGARKVFHWCFCRFGKRVLKFIQIDPGPAQAFGGAIHGLAARIPKL